MTRAAADPTDAWPPGRRWGLVAGPVLGLATLVARPEAVVEPAWGAAAVGVLMAVWWTTEALPIAVTSLLPLLLFPLLGVVDLRDAAAPYANPLVFLFLGGFLIALAIEGTGLHRRLALRIVLALGASPRRLVVGFLLASASLSLWISNTATALMMLPIAVSVASLDRGSSSGRGPSSDREAVALLLAVAYGSSLGGLATLIGTPTNALLAGFLLESYGYELTFARWLVVGLPLSVVGLAATAWLLTRMVSPDAGGEGDRAADPAQEEAEGTRVVSASLEASLRGLGPMSRAERWVALVFALTAVAWIARPLLARLVPGLSDTGIALAGALSLFAVPLDWRHGRFVLHWRDTERLPWGILLLFGGGLSLAAAIRDTGLSAVLGEAMQDLGSWPTPLLVATLTLVVVLLTELTSNTATAAAFLPVLGSMAVGLGRDPMLFLLPATFAASCAFMLPVATPPNAIVYGSGRLTVPTMARAGLVLNLVFVALITLLTVALWPLVGFEVPVPAR